VLHVAAADRTLICAPNVHTLPAADG
jgi:hypothetical protein